LRIKADKNYIPGQVHCAKLQWFRRLGSGIIALEMRCLPYLYCSDYNAGRNLQQCPLSNVTAVFGCIAQSWIMIDKNKMLSYRRETALQGAL